MIKDILVIKINIVHEIFYVYDSINMYVYIFIKNIILY